MLEHMSGISGLVSISTKTFLYASRVILNGFEPRNPKKLISFGTRQRKVDQNVAQNLTQFARNRSIPVPNSE